MTRLEKLAALAKEKGCDGLLITEEENLCYATGFVGLEGMVLITADGKGFCHTDSRYIEAVENAVSPLGYQVSQPEQGYPACAAALCKKEGLQKLLFEDRAMRVSDFRRYESTLPCQLEPARDGFSLLREVKEEEEIQHITAAQRIAEQALQETLPLIKPGVSERELVAELEYRMSRLGSTGVSFSTILISGPKTSMPHGVPSEKKLETGDFITIDFGAMVAGYHSDMTRTFALGYVTDEMKKIYNIVLRAQLAGIEALSVGATGIEVDAAARDIIKAEGYGDYFGHGLGHSVGLNIHEEPRASWSYPRAFQSGNVITMEPGIYLPGRFGVRIEDMIYLDGEKKQNLTAFPKDLCIL